jgi:hypothetical protein
MKLYNNQSNAQILNLFIYLLLPYMFWFFLAHLQRQVYNIGSGSSPLVWCQRPSADTIPNLIPKCTVLTT